MIPKGEVRQNSQETVMRLKTCSLSSAQSSYDFESAPEPPDDENEDSEMEDPEDSWEYFSD